MPNAYDENTESVIAQVIEQKPEYDRDSLLADWDNDKPHFGGIGPHRYDDNEQNCSYCGRPKNWTNRTRYTVIVGNIGTVHDAYDEHVATQIFNEYVHQSTTIPGARCYGEPVTLMRDDEIAKEHEGHYSQDDADESPYDDADPVALLEELLTLTEPLKPNMDSKTLRTWQQISAAAADLRDPSLLD